MLLVNNELKNDAEETRCDICKVLS